MYDVGCLGIATLAESEIIVERGLEMTCPFCHGFRDDTYECSCKVAWLNDVKAGHLPPGIIAPKAFNYQVWREIREIESALDSGVPLEEVKEKVRKRAEKAEADYQESEARRAARIAYEARSTGIGRRYTY